MEIRSLLIEPASSSETSKVVSESKISKLQLSSKSFTGPEIMKNRYVVVYRKDADLAECFQTFKNHMKQYYRMEEESIRQNLVIQSNLLNALSVTVPDDCNINYIKSSPGVINAYPVHKVKRVEPSREFISGRSAMDNSGGGIISHDWTGVAEVHKRLGNFGRGVRVSLARNFQLNDSVCRSMYN